MPVSECLYLKEEVEISIQIKVILVCGKMKKVKTLTITRNFTMIQVMIPACTAKEAMMMMTNLQKHNEGNGNSRWMLNARLLTLRM